MNSAPRVQASPLPSHCRARSDCHSSLTSLFGAMLLLVSFFAGNAMANPQVEACKAKNESFDFDGVLLTCSLATADPGLKREERIAVYQLLGIAHIALGSEDNGAIWFTRLLMVDPSHTLPAEVGPVFQKAFAKVQKEFSEKGAVTVTHLPSNVANIDKSAPIPVRFEVKDHYGRVQEARIRLVVLEGDKELRQMELPLVEAPVTGGHVFSGTLPALDTLASAGSENFQVEYKLELTSLLGDAVSANPAFVPVRFTVEGNASPAVGGAAALMLVGGSVAGFCALSGSCFGGQDDTETFGYVRLGPARGQTP